MALGVSLAGYHQAQQSLSWHIHQEISAIVEAHVNKLDGWFWGKTKPLLVAAEVINEMYTEKEVPAILLSAHYRRDRDISDLYFGLANGDFVDGSGWSPPLKEASASTCILM